MTDLVEFLRARLDEVEEQARTAIRGMPSDPTPMIISVVRADDGIPPPALMIYQHPERELREVEAKRQLIRAHAQPHECVALTGSGKRSAVDGRPWELWEPAHTDDHGPCLVLRCLALPYADHSQYRKEWRP